MLLLALTLTLSSLQLPPASSLHLVQTQLDDAVASQPDVTRARLVQIEKELSAIRTTWPTGSVVLMAVGFGGTVTFALAGLVVGILVSGLPGAFILTVGLAVGALSLMLGLSGVIWGAVHAGVNRGRIQRLEEERALLLRQADGQAPLVLPPLITLATF